MDEPALEETAGAKGPGADQIGVTGDEQGQRGRRRDIDAAFAYVHRRWLRMPPSTRWGMGGVSILTGLVLGAAPLLWPGASPTSDGVVPAPPESCVPSLDDVAGPSPQVCLSARSMSATTFADQTTASPGGVVDLRVYYRNVGDELSRDVTVAITLPTQLRYLSGTTSILDVNNPIGAPVNDDLVAADGLNIGSFTPGSNALVVMTVQVADASGFTCGETTQVAVLVVRDGGQTRRDDVGVVVQRSC